jgi:chorismate mutase
MTEIPKLRKKVDEIDDRILAALCERVMVCREIGSVKKKQGKPVKDASRETEVFRQIKEKSAEFGLNPVQIERVYREIVNMCSAVQE